MAFDVVKYIQQRNTQPTNNNSQQGFSVAKYVKDKNASSAVQSINDRLGTWLTNNENFVKNYQSRFSGTSSKYRSDTADQLSTVTAQKANFDKEADSILALVDQYSDYLDSDYVSKVKDALDQSRSAQSEILSAYTQDNDYWSQFGSEESYNAYVKQQEKYKKLARLDILDAKDYGQYSKAGESKLKWGGLAGDGVYDYINNIDNYANKQDGAGAMNGGNSYGIYRQMTEDEVGIYNYIYAKEGKKQADEYLNSLEQTLKDRQAGMAYENTVKFANEHPVLSSALSIPASLLSGGEYIADVIAAPFTGEVDRNQLSDFSSTVRGTVSEKASWEIGNWDAGAFLYNTGMSMADSVSSMLTFGNLGGTALGLSAAAQGTNDALQRGMSDGQAFWNGLFSGVFEGLFETVSIGNFNKLKEIAPATFGDIAWNIGKSMLVNASEETLTEIANIAYDTLANGEYANYTLEELKDGDTWKQIALQIAEAGGSGALMGIGFGGAGSTIGYVTNSLAGKKLSNQYGYTAKEVVAEALEIDPNNATALRLKEKLDAGKTVSNAELNTLVQQNEKALVEGDISSIRSAAEARLTELGERGNVRAIAEALAKEASGQTLTRAEQRTLNNSQFGQRVSNELNTKNIRSGEYSSAWVEQIDTDRINVEEYSSLVRAAEVAQEGDLSTTEESASLPKNASQAGKMEVAEKAAEVVDKPETAQVQEVKEAPKVASAFDVQTETTAAIGEESTEVEEDAEEPVTLEAASKKYGAQAGAMIHTYTPGQDVERYDSAYQIAYDMGKSGVSLSYAMKSEATAYLGESQRELAYEAGQAAADRRAVELETQNKNAANGKSGRRKGVVKGEGVTIADLKKSFNDPQGRAYRVLATIAEATGIDIVLYQSEIGDDGQLIGAQGKFKWSDDTIYIDVNSGLTYSSDVGSAAKYTMLRTFSHEFTHFLEKWNPIRYNEFRKVVFDTLTERGENVDDLIEDTQRRNKGLNYDAASREVVAEAMTDVLPDANFVQMLAEQHKSVFEKLLEQLKAFVAEIKAYFASLAPNRSFEANALKEQVGGTVRYLESIVKLFDNVAVEAVENYQAAVAVEEATVSEMEKVEESPAKIDSTEAINADEDADFAENAQKNNAEGVVRYSERDYDYSKPFSEQIDDYLSGNFPQRDTLIVGGTPQVLRKIGFNALPMTMNQTHVDYALNGSKNAEHHIGETMLKQLPTLLQNPVAVIVSQSHPSTSVVVIVSMQHNGDQVIAPVYLDGTGRQNGVSIDSNAITSIHGRSNAITGLLKNALDREANGSIGIYYADKAKTASLLTTAGVTMPQGLSLGDGFIHSIRENASPVKPKLQNVTESQQFKRWFGDWQNHPERASKVVNEDGTPKVMYHGTRAENGEFWEFDYNKAKKKGGLGFKALGQGNYFTSQKLDGTEMFGSRVIEAYLSIKKPFTAETGAGFDFRKQVSEVLGINASQMTYPAIQNAMREQGYDGVIQYDKNGEITIAVTFDSTQIKSATDNIGTFDGTNPDIRYQQRTNTLTDREVLAMAADQVKVDDLNAAEQDALRIFKSRLDKLEKLQVDRAEQGRLYKEQQFGSKVDRDAAAKTLNRMHVLDGQIKRASADVLAVEETTLLQQVLQKARKVVEAEERKHGQELLARWRDRRNNAAAIKKYRERIRHDVDELTNWILKPSNKDVVKHVPDVLKSSVIPFLSSIDFTSKRQLGGGEATAADKAFVKRMQDLKAALKQNTEAYGLYSGYTDLPPDFADRLQTFIDTAQALVDSHSGEHIINQMTADELNELSKVVKTLKQYITNFNRFHANAMYQHVYEAGNNTIEALEQMKDDGGKAGAVSNFVLWQQMRPAYAFERFGEGGKAIYDGLRRGQAQLAFNTKEIIAFSEKTYTEAEVKAWEQEIKEIKLGDDVVKMPVSAIMSFYELSKQPDSLRHMLGGGIRVATTKMGKQKISDVGHIITELDVATIVGTLTDRQREVADALQQYMAVQGGKWGNYISVARFGEELFGNPQYFPINSDGRHLQSTADENPSAASLYALLNMSFTKSRNEHANNRIILYSIFDVFANHMASMAQYNAMALPVLDALKWFNYQQKSEPDENGRREIVTGVREQMARVYGVPEETKPGSGKQGYAETFVMNILKAFNGTEAQGSTYDTSGLNMLRRYNMAQVAYNFRVVVQQPLAVTRAGLLLGNNSILKSLKNLRALEKNVAEMRKYSGIAAWKSLGFYDVNISRGLTDLIKHNETTLDKIGEFGMKGAEFADTMTWASIWSACKEEVVKKQRLQPSDKGFYDAVTKLFEDVVYKTQVVDSVLTKNEYLRSKGLMARTLGSFMAEPTTTASMVVDAYVKYHSDIQRGMTRNQVWQKNGKLIARTTYVYAIGAVLLAAVQAVPDAFRDDDEYEDFLEKWLEAFGGNLIDELMPFNKLPLINNFYDLAKELLSVLGVDTYGNLPSSVIMQWYDSLVKGTEIVYDKIVGEDTNYTWYGGIYKLLQAASGMSGLPMASATREVITFWNNVVGAMAPSLKVKTYDSGDKNEIKYAYMDGYLTAEEATELLLEKGLAETEDEAYWLIEEWSADGDHSRYGAVYDAVLKGGDFDAAMSEMLAHGYDEETVLSSVKSQIGRWYYDDKSDVRITKQQAIDMLTKYTDIESDEITAQVNKWSCKVVTGIAYNHISDEFIEGNITEKRAIEMYMLYGGVSEKDATEKVAALAFEKEHPECEGISYAAVEAYKEYCEPAGIDAGLYYKARKKCNSFESDRDENDKPIPGQEKRDKALAYIDTLDLTVKQKDALYYAFGYKKSTLYKAPWH